MDTTPVPPLPPPDAAPSEPSSLTDRLTDVIAAPGEVFEEISTAPVRNINWAVPLILSVIATSIYICVAFSQPGLLRQMKEQRDNAIQKKVATGQMTQAQADQSEVVADKFTTPALLMAFGIGGAALAATGGLFLLGLTIWLFLKWFAGTSIDYMKVVEVCGLALVIDIPQKIVRIALMAWKGNWLATASPALFLDNPSNTNRHDVLLSMFDVIDLWWLAVLSVGVSKVARVPYRTAAFITFGIWFGFRFIALLLIPSQS
jgi:hypothetical protein